MRANILIVAAVVVGCASAPGQANDEAECLARVSSLGEPTGRGESALRLIACPVSSIVTDRDPIQVAVLLQNVSDSAIVVRPSLLFGAWLDADIVGPGGTVLDRGGSIEPRVSEPVALNAGEFVGRVVRLRCNQNESPSCFSPYLIEEAGAYRIQMTYSYPCDYGSCAQGQQTSIKQIRAAEFTVRVQ
jgi:hypothetical protein